MEGDMEIIENNKKNWKKIELHYAWLIFFIVATSLNYIYATITFEPISCGPVPFCGSSYTWATLLEIFAIIPTTGVLLGMDIIGKKVARKIASQPIINDADLTIKGVKAGKVHLIKMICLVLLAVGVAAFLIAQKFEDTNTKKKFLQQETDNALTQVYKNEKYEYSLYYPKDWKVVEKENFTGPYFMQSNLDYQNLAIGKYDKSRDCAFSVAVINDFSQDGVDSFCKNKTDTVAIGSLTFRKCSFVSVLNNEPIEDYVIFNSKNNTLLDFSPINNANCASKTIGILKYLKF
jgi:hypothetical protein